MWNSKGVSPSRRLAWYLHYLACRSVCALAAEAGRNPELRPRRRTVQVEKHGVGAKGARTSRTGKRQTEQVMIELERPVQVLHHGQQCP